MTAIIQPGGSIRDEMAIEVADRHHLAMVFTGRRHFRHWRADRPAEEVEKLLALEMVRVTEAAAIASARLMGRGDRMEADRLATEAMRAAMDEIEMAGTIVIGEGERDEAPMLYIGEQVGMASEVGAGDRHRRRPARGTNLVATGSANAITVLAASESGRPRPRAGHVPREAVRRPEGGRPGRHHPGRRPRTSAGSPRPSAGRPQDITVIILDRPRHADLIAEVRRHGARIKLITDGDLSAAISCASRARASTRSWASAAPRRA